MVKTPTYPLAAFNYVTLCSFEVYRQITCGHLLCTVVKFLTWSSEIFLLKEWSHVPRLRGSRFTHSVLLGAGRRSVDSVAQLHDPAYKTTSRRVCSCAPWSRGGGHPCKSWPGVPRFPMVSHGFWCMISPALWLSWILKPRYFQACLAIQEALAFQEPA